MSKTISKIENASVSFITVNKSSRNTDYAYGYLRQSDTEGRFQSSLKFIVWDAAVVAQMSHVTDTLEATDTDVSGPLTDGGQVVEERKIVHSINVEGYWESQKSKKSDDWFHQFVVTKVMKVTA
jgi:hypothetical protein